MVARMSQSVVVVVLVVVGCFLAMVTAQATVPHDQIGEETSVTASDQTPSATHGHGGGHGVGGGKFFMYAHQPAKKEYEFGFKRGDDYHTVERYEKGGPHHNFKTKVRWHDAKGGHGEHYWDYNHAPKYHDDHGDDHHGGYDDHGHGGDDYHGDDYHDDHGDHGGYHSQPVPDYAPAATTATATGVPSAATQQRKAQSFESPSFRARRKPEDDSTAGVKKDSELDKKNYHYYNEKKTFEYKMTSSNPDEPQSKMETPSAFPQVLGFNPYLPPEIAEEPFFAEDVSSPPAGIHESKQVSSPARISPQPRFSASKPQYSTSMPQYQAPESHYPTPKLQYPTPKTSTTFGRRSAAGGAKSPKSKDSDTKQAKSASTLTGLSFDPKTGRIYNEATGMWYSLVPVAEA